MSQKRRHTTGLLLWILILTFGAWAQSRVVAVGDAHAHYQPLEAILKRTGLIDAQAHWAGGDAVLVQLGDLMDRGTQSRQCMDLMMKLESEAPQAKGRVIVVLGNHEVINLIGDLHNPVSEDYGSFAGPDSESVREKAFRDYLAWVTDRNQRLNLPGKTEAEERKTFLTRHPLGYFEHREAYSPQGRYGAWIRKHQAVAQIGDVIFLHGGLDPKQQFQSVDEINSRIQHELAAFDSMWEKLVQAKIIWRYTRLRRAINNVQEELKLKPPQGAALVEAMNALVASDKWLLTSENGPLEFEGYSKKPKRMAEINQELGPMLKRLHATHIVVGHSPNLEGKIIQGFDGRVFRIDTGLHNPEDGGKPAGLEIRKGVFSAFYMEGQPEVFPASGTQGAEKVKLRKRTRSPKPAKPKKSTPAIER